MKLTDAQIYTLRRLRSGTVYRIQGNGKRAYEARVEYQNTGYSLERREHPVNAPSIPVLKRLDLVMTKHNPARLNDTSYYPVMLTEKGWDAVKTLKVSTEL